MNKKTAAEIASYFDGEVERFSDLAKGQASIKDARLMMDLFVEIAPVLVPVARRILDLGCGAGNQTLNLLRAFPDADCTLLDLSSAMLERAQERVGSVAAGKVKFVSGDLRTAELPTGEFDIVVAAAVLHHLRDEADWIAGFSRIRDLLRDGGVLLVSDLIRHANPAVEAIFKTRQETFLREALGDAEAERIMRSIAASDTPSPLEYQFSLLRRLGFREVSLLHKNIVFGAYYAIK